MQKIKKRILRWAPALAVVAIAAGGTVSAQAATGGASSYAGVGGSAPEGQEPVFGAMKYGGASWYGPGLWGHKTACGVTLHRNTLGVAHKTLPCGTTVRFVYQGHVVVTQVIDRGPYVKGRAWDLTSAAAEAIGLEGVGRVGYAVATELARPGTR